MRGPLLLLLAGAAAAFEQEELYQIPPPPGDAREAEAQVSQVDQGWGVWREDYRQVRGDLDPVLETRDRVAGDARSLAAGLSSGATGLLLVPERPMLDALPSGEDYERLQESYAPVRAGYKNLRSHTVSLRESPLVTGGARGRIEKLDGQLRTRTDKELSLYDGLFAAPEREGDPPPPGSLAAVEGQAREVVRDYVGEQSRRFQAEVREGRLSGPRGELPVGILNAPEDLRGQERAAYEGTWREHAGRTGEAWRRFRDWAGGEVRHLPEGERRELAAEGERAEGAMRMLAAFEEHGPRFLDAPRAQRDLVFRLATGEEVDLPGRPQGTARSRSLDEALHWASAGVFADPGGVGLGRAAGPPRPDGARPPEPKAAPPPEPGEPPRAGPGGFALEALRGAAAGPEQAEALLARAAGGAPPAESARALRLLGDLRLARSVAETALDPAEFEAALLRLDEAAATLARELGLDPAELAAGWRRGLRPPEGSRLAGLPARPREASERAFRRLDAALRRGDLEGAYRALEGLERALEGAPEPRGERARAALAALRGRIAAVREALALERSLNPPEDSAGEGREALLLAVAALPLPGPARDRARRELFLIEDRRGVERRAEATAGLLEALGGDVPPELLADYRALREAGPEAEGARDRLAAWQRDADAALRSEPPEALRREAERRRSFAEAYGRAQEAARLLALDPEAAALLGGEDAALLDRDPAGFDADEAARLRAFEERLAGTPAGRAWLEARRSAEEAARGVDQALSELPQLAAYRAAGAERARFLRDRLERGWVPRRARLEPAELGLEGLPEGTLVQAGAIAGRHGVWLIPPRGSGARPVFRTLDGSYVVQRTARGSHHVFYDEEGRVRRMAEREGERTDWLSARGRRQRSVIRDGDTLIVSVPSYDRRGRRVSERLESTRGGPGGELVGVREETFDPESGRRLRASDADGSGALLSLTTYRDDGSWVTEDAEGRQFQFAAERGPDGSRSVRILTAQTESMAVQRPDGSLEVLSTVVPYSSHRPLMDEAGRIMGVDLETGEGAPNLEPLTAAGLMSPDEARQLAALLSGGEEGARLVRQEDGSWALTWTSTFGYGERQETRTHVARRDEGRWVVQRTSEDRRGRRRTDVDVYSNLREDGRWGTWESYDARRFRDYDPTRWDSEKGGYRRGGDRFRDGVVYRRSVLAPGGGYSVQEEQRPDEIDEGAWGWVQRFGRQFAAEWEAPVLREIAGTAEWLGERGLDFFYFVGSAATGFGAVGDDPETTIMGTATFYQMPGVRGLTSTASYLDSGGADGVRYVEADGTTRVVDHDEEAQRVLGADLLTQLERRLGPREFRNRLGQWETRYREAQAAMAPDPATAYAIRHSREPIGRQDLGMFLLNGQAGAGLHGMGSELARVAADEAEAGSWGTAAFAGGLSALTYTGEFAAMALGMEAPAGLLSAELNVAVRAGRISLPTAERALGATRLMQRAQGVYFQGMMGQQAIAAVDAFREGDTAGMVDAAAQLAALKATPHVGPRRGPTEALAREALARQALESGRLGEPARAEPGRQPALERGPEPARAQLAERLLGRELSSAQREAVQRAHEVGEGELGRDGGPAGLGNYTQAQIARKARILRGADFTPAETRALMEAGIAGSEAAPPSAEARALAERLAEPGEGIWVDRSGRPLSGRPGVLDRMRGARQVELRPAEPGSRLLELEGAERLSPEARRTAQQAVDLHNAGVRAEAHRFSARGAEWSGRDARTRELQPGSGVHELTGPDGSALVVKTRPSAREAAALRAASEAGVPEGVDNVHIPGYVAEVPAGEASARLPPGVRSGGGAVLVMERARGESLQEFQHGFQAWEGPPITRAEWQNLVETVRRLNERGVEHQDLGNASNIRVWRDASGRVHFELIDWGSGAGTRTPDLQALAGVEAGLVARGVLEPRRGGFEPGGSRSPPPVPGRGPPPVPADARASAARLGPPVEAAPRAPPRAPPPPPQAPRAPPPPKGAARPARGAPLEPARARELAERARRPQSPPPDAVALDARTLEAAGLSPRHTVELGGARYHLSEVFRLPEGRLGCLAQVELPNGEVRTVLLWRSNSQASWRLSEATMGRSHFGKGFHETDIQLPIELSNRLHRLSERPAALRDPATGEVPQGAEAQAELGRRLGFGAMEGFRGDPRAMAQALQAEGGRYEAGELVVRRGEGEGVSYYSRSYAAEVSAEPARLGPPVEGTLERARGEPLPEPSRVPLPPAERLPDFSRELDRIEFTNERYAELNGGDGRLTGRVFESRDGSVRYLFVVDSAGRASLAAAELTGAPVTSFGNRGRWLDLGGMDAPLFDYRAQIPRRYLPEAQRGLPAEQLRGYQLNWDYVSELPLIRLYYDAQGLVRPPPLEGPPR